MCRVRLLLSVFMLTASLVLGFGAAVGQADKKTEDKKTEVKKEDKKEDKKDGKKDKEPPPKEEKILDKTIGEWITILRTHENPKLRRVALLALEAGAQAHKTGLSAVLDATDQEKEKEPMIRVEAIKLLGRMDPKTTKGALRTVVAVMQTDKSDSVREAAANVLGRDNFKGAAADYADALAAALKDTHAGTRIAVAAALRNMGQGARPAFPALTESAKNPKEELLVRLAAVHVLSRHSEDSAKVLPLLLELANNTENAVALREVAIEGLGRIRSDAPEAVTALCKGLTDKNLDLRKASAAALGVLGAKAKAGWPAISERLKSKDGEPDSSVRNHLIRLTGTLAKTNADAIDVLIDRAKNDGSTENRIAAIQELAELGTLAKSALKTLDDIASLDARAAVREAAAKATKQIRGQ